MPVGGGVDSGPFRGLGALGDENRGSSVEGWGSRGSWRASPEAAQTHDELGLIASLRASAGVNNESVHLGSNCRSCSRRIDRMQRRTILGTVQHLVR